MTSFGGGPPVASQRPALVLPAGGHARRAHEREGALAARNAINPAQAAPCATVPYFWSDWNHDRIQFVGSPAVDEVRVVAGDPEKNFLALYRRGDHIIGALGLNQRPTAIQLRVLSG